MTRTTRPPATAHMHSHAPARTGGARRAARLLLAAFCAHNLAAVAAIAGCEEGRLGQTNRTDHFCSWTGFSGYPYIPNANIQLYEDLLPTNCTDPRLSAEDQFFCKRCCAQTNRTACLGSVGRQWHDGADTQSCSWMSRDSRGLSVREVEYTIGVNFPYNIANMVDRTTCREERLYTVLSPPEAYTTAYFTVLASTDDPDDTISRPPGLAPDASCIVRSPERACIVNFYASDDVHFVMSSRDMWTKDPKIIRSLRTPGNEDCLYRPGAKCAPASTPFRYRLHLTLHPCPAGQRQPELVRSLGAMPMSEPGVLLAPGGSPLNYRQTGYYLQGAENVTWTIRAEKWPILVAVVSQADAWTYCPQNDGTAATAMCDYRRISQAARRGTLCFNWQCRGALRNRPDPWTNTDILLIVGGLRYPNEEQLVPQGTVQQNVWVDIRADPPPHVDALKRKFARRKM